MSNAISSSSASQDASPRLPNGIPLTTQFLISTMELAQYEIDQDIAAEDHPGFDSLIEQLAILRDHQVNITEFMGEGAIFPPALALTGPINLVVNEPEHPPVTGGGFTFTPPELVANLPATDVEIAHGGDNHMTAITILQLCVLDEQQTSIFAFLGNLMPPSATQYEAGEITFLGWALKFLDVDTGIINMAVMDEVATANVAARTQRDNGQLNHHDAVAFVSTLEAVDLSALDASDRCPHCWSNWGEDTEINNSPIRLPCANGQHIFGFDCLVEILTAVGPLCPICRVNIVTPSA